ncbi:MAG: hypothetical protein EBZ48_15150 [Proteobacteria bacterium]|nr:hypothetical protein [Pseudomonadota bacterium]
MRPRRKIQSGGIYEICMRTARGLPFCATGYMEQIIKGVIARVQRDHKVGLIALVFMANHPHILIEALDRGQCKQFYGELQKQLTDAVKRLTGKKHLNLWRRNCTSVVRYGDLASVQERIAYAFANPARANLVDTIERYPGVSSFKAFMAAPCTLEAAVTEMCPWIQAPMICKLPARSVTEGQDRALTQRMRKMSVASHELTYYPNRWMVRFGVTAPEEIKAVNKVILLRLRELEEQARIKRAQNGWKVMGALRLGRQPLDLDRHEPPQSRRIFIYALDKTIRIAMIEEYRHFCTLCRECYEAWKIGDFSVQWPPGAYQPAPPVTVNWLVT